MSLLSRLLSRSLPTPKAITPARLQLVVQQLEDRTTPTVSFDSGFTTGGRAHPNDVAVDAAGNSYLTGWFQGTTDFDLSDPGDATDTLTATGTGDAFVAKYAPDNSLIWVRRMGANAGVKLALDGGGNVAVVGSYSEPADFGSTVLTPAGGQDAYIAKPNVNGDFLWAKRWGGVYEDVGRGVGFDAGGNVYALSQRSANATDANNGYDIVKFNSNGGTTWSKSITTRYYLPSAGFGVDATGNTFIGGCYIGSVDFDPGNKSVYRLSAGTTGSGYCGAFVLKLTSAGAYSWVTTLDSGHAFVRDLALSGSNVVVSAYVGSGTVLQPASGSKVALPAATSVVYKLNGSGQHVWSAPLTGATAGDIAVDSAGSIYATGYFNGTADFDPGTDVASRTSVGSSDVFVLKLTTTGGLGWVETFGGVSIDQGNGIAVDATGTVSVVGSFYSDSVDFDPDPTATFDLARTATSNLFAVKLRQS